MFTVGQIINAMASDIGGSGLVLDGDEEARLEAFEVYNEITRLLMLEEMVETNMCLPIWNNCVTLDRRIETIMAARLNSQVVTVRSRTFRYQDNGPGDRILDGDFVTNLEDMGDGFATHQDLPRPMNILAFSDREEDEAAELVIGGVDPHHGRDVRHRLSIKKGTDLSGPPTYTGGDTALSLPATLESVRSLYKTRTKGYVYVWGFLPNPEDHHEMVWLTTMAPDEENACHRRYRIRTDCAGYKSLDVKALLRWIPLYNEHDVSLIQHPDCYKRMARGLNALNGTDDRDYERWRNRAVSILRKARNRKNVGQQRVPNISTSRGGSRIRSLPTRPLFRNR